MANGKLQRILVPTDFSDLADEALGMAITMARMFGATIEVLHVAGTASVLPPPMEVVSFATLVPDLYQQLQRKLEDSVPRLKVAEVPYETHLMEGVAHLEIVKRAEEMKADLIVMGTHGHGALAHAVLGSVTERVLHRAHCPVLVVPVPRTKYTHP